jgi:hypothetical protein
MNFEERMAEIVRGLLHDDKNIRTKSIEEFNASNWTEMMAPLASSLINIMYGDTKYYFESLGACGGSARVNIEDKALFAGEALARIGSFAVISLLIKSLETKNLQGNVLAIKALGEMNAVAAEDILISILQRASHPMMANVTACALGNMKSLKAAPALIHCLTASNNYSLICNAAWALGEIQTKDAVAPLLETYNAHKDEIIRKRISDTLSLLGSNVEN